MASLAQHRLPPLNYLASLAYFDLTPCFRGFPDRHTQQPNLTFLEETWQGCHTAKLFRLGSYPPAFAANRQVSCRASQLCYAR